VALRTLRLFRQKQRVTGTAALHRCQNRTCGYISGPLAAPPIFMAAKRALPPYDPLLDKHLQPYLRGPAVLANLKVIGLVGQDGRRLPVDAPAARAQLRLLDVELRRATTEAETIEREEAALRAQVAAARLVVLEEEQRARLRAVALQEAQIRREIVRIASAPDVAGEAARMAAVSPLPAGVAGLGEGPGPFSPPEVLGPRVYRMVSGRAEASFIAHSRAHSRAVRTREDGRKEDGCVRACV